MLFGAGVDLLLTLGLEAVLRGISRASLIGLRETLSQSGGNEHLSLSDFGRMLGKAAGRFPYSRSYISKLLAGTKPVTEQVARGARVLMVSVAALEEKDWIDPLPTFEGGPIDKLKQARAEGVEWQDLYATNADVRAFIDVLVDVIVRG